MTECYFILLAPSLPDNKLAWFDMHFVNVNQYPVPFDTMEEAEDYRKVWGMTDETTSIYKVSIIKN